MQTVLTFVGLAFLVLAAYLLARRLSVYARGAAADGHVVGHEARTDDDSVSYLPVVEFTDAEGRTHRFTSVAGGSTRSPAVGAAVRVRYDPRDPRAAYIQSFLHMWAAPLACVVLAAGALAARW